MCRQTGDDGDQLGGLHGLGQVQLEAGAQRTEPILGSGIGGQRHRGDGPSLLRGAQAQLPDQLVAIGSGHLDVAQEHVDSLPAQDLEGLAGGRDRFDECALTFEHLRDEHPGVVVVFHDQHLDPREVGRFFQSDDDVRLRIDALVRGRCRDRGPGQPYRERGALTGPGAFRLDAAAVQLDELSRDGKPHAQTPGGPRARRVPLSEAFEDEGKELGVDAETGVDNCDLDGGIDGLDVHPNPAMLRRELDGVGEEVPDYLLHSLWISHYLATRGVLDELESYVLGVSRRRYRPNRRLHYRPDPHRPQIELKLPGDDPRYVQELFDNLAL